MRVEFRQGVPEGCFEWLNTHVGKGKVEFRQGVPEGCFEWLNTHVGKGNTAGFVDNYEQTYAWFYRLERVYPQPHDPRDDWGPKYVPTITITVKDPKLATWFALRWSS